LYNPSNEQYISYDDPVSLDVKAQYALNNDLAGLFVWSVDKDNGELLSASAPMVASNPAKTLITNGTTSSTTTTTAATTTTTIKNTTTTAAAGTTATTVATTTSASATAAQS
jgi:chitinase